MMGTLIFCFQLHKDKEIKRLWKKIIHSFRIRRFKLITSRYLVPKLEINLVNIKLNIASKVNFMKISFFAENLKDIIKIQL
jgi:hypothetical protein